MYSHRTTRRPLLLALACVMALALAIPTVASADGPSPYTSERDSASPTQSIVGDRPSERDSGGTVSPASSAGSSSSDDGTNVALIVGLSLAGLAAGGTAWVVVRRHRGRLTARPSH
jgi:hypothetical protein